MSLTDIPLFGMLRQKLSYLDQRQKLVAQNVANADTPGYVPTDLKDFSFSSQLQMQSGGGGGLAMAASEPGHLAGASLPSTGPYKAVNAPDSETTLDGNSVDLEEQMMKMTQARMDFDTAIGFYQKATSMIQLAARKPGQ